MRRQPPISLAMALVVSTCLWLIGCQSTPEDIPHPHLDVQPEPILEEEPPPPGPPLPKGYARSDRVYHGKASWYSIKTNHGTVTASGERLRNDARTAAHRSLPFGTRVLVTNLRNGHTAVVRITDRGPFIKGRIIDVTIGVARSLGMVTAGVVPCTVEVLERLPESNSE